MSSPPYLYIEKNHRWSGHYRKGLGAAEDMDALRRALAVLLDEEQPIRERLPKALDRVAGLGKGIATAILTVAHPTQYGVWNNTSEAALRQLGLWPDFERGAAIGGRYAQINDLLARLAANLEMDFWTLDAFWVAVLEPQPENSPPPILETSSLGG